MKKITTLSILLLFSLLTGFAQENDCVTSGAGQLTVENACNLTTFDSSNNTDYWNSATGCNATDGDDAWGWFVGTGNDVTISYTPDSRDAILTVFTGSCSTSMSSLACADAAGAGGTETITISTTLGQVYMVRIERSGSDNSMTGDICIYDPLLPAPGGGTSCSDAVTLTPGTQQCGTNSNVGSFPDGGGAPTNPCSSSYNDGEYWFQYTGTGNALTLDVTGLTDTWSGIFVLDACPGSGPTCIDSYTNGSSTSDYSLTTPALTLGQTYYIVIANYASPYQTDFCLDATEVVPPPPGAGDGCTNAVTLTPGTTQCGTNNNVGEFPDDGSSPTNPCSSSYNDGEYWFEYTGTGDALQLDVSGLTDTYSGIFVLDACPSSGTPSCLASYTSGFSSADYSITTPLLTLGNTYYIVIANYASPYETDFCLDATEVPPPTPCTGDVIVNTTYYSNTGMTTCGFGDDFTSSDACGSYYMDGDDIVIQYTPTTSECINISLSNTDYYTGIFVLNLCPDQIGATCLASATTSGTDPTLSGFSVTAGTTYYIVISTYPSPQCTPFDIDIYACPPPPANDECVNAELVPVSVSTCSYTSGTVENATASSQANDCYGTTNNDVWYSFVATTASVQISLSNITGSATDMYHSVYEGSCGSIGTALECSDPNNSTITGLTVGNTYFVRVYTYGSSTANTDFDLCILEAGACGTPENQDFCVAPAILTQGGTSFSANTSDTYSADEPGNLWSEFCGSIENNSWYQFVADSTTHTFNFVSISGCLTDGGVQAEVYDVTTDVNGCCTDFTSMSNCYNPANTAPGVVTATGLTIGETYWLMVDGQAGDICDFTVANWSATGILPLANSAIDLTGIRNDRELDLIWKTDEVSNSNTEMFELVYSSNNTDYYVIRNFSPDQTPSYLFHTIAPTEKGYYQIKATMKDGTVRYSNLYISDIQVGQWGISTLFPNPNDGKFNIQLKTNSETAQLEIIDFTGKVLATQSILHKGSQQVVIELQDLPHGHYTLRLIDDSNVQYTPFIKN